jgi:WD40 repeat protein
MEFVQQLHPPHYDGVDALCLLGSEFLLSASRDKSMKIWDISQGEIFQSKVVNSAHKDWINALIIHQNSVYSACKDGTIAAWDKDSLVQSSYFHAHSASVNALATSNNTNILISASSDKMVSAWQL